MHSIDWAPPAMDDREVEEHLGDNAGLSGVDRARMSRLLCEQLAHGIATRTLDSFAVTDVVRSLESLPGTRRRAESRPFNNPPLKGLLHAHFVQASFIPRNLTLELSYKNGGRNFEAAVQTTHGVLDDSTIAKIAHEATVGMYERRAARGALTGEWIIFAESRRRRFYLSVAAHGEGDEVIYRRMMDRCEERFRKLIMEATQ